MVTLRRDCKKIPQDCHCSGMLCLTHKVEEKNVGELANMAAACKIKALSSLLPRKKESYLPKKETLVRNEDRGCAGHRAKTLSSGITITV
jgi:hypothetical protein